MLRPTPTLIAFLLAHAIPLGAQTAGSELTITLEHDSDAEREMAEQLRSAVDRYDVGHWIITRHIHIEERAIPHSHPVLTIHTRHRGDDHGLQRPARPRDRRGARVRARRNGDTVAAVVP